MPHYAVHIPMKAKEELIAKYPGWDGTPHGRQENPVYAAMLESLDESVGRIVAKVDELGLAGNTLIIFTSDNGGLATLEGPNTPPTINAPLREGKGYLYEGGLRVPLIVRWPGRVAQRVENTPVWAADLPMTVKALCGLPGPIAGDGVSLASLLTEARPLASRPLFWHYPHYSNQGGRPGGAVRDGDWKLVEDYQTGRRELFDLGRDVSESTNLAESRARRRSRSWPPSSPPGARRRRPDAHAQPSLRPQRPARERHDPTAGQHRRGPWRDAPVRAATAQEHPRLLGPRRRLGVLGIRRRKARNVRGSQH